MDHWTAKEQRESKLNRERQEKNQRQQGSQYDDGHKKRQTLSRLRAEYYD